MRNTVSIFLILLITAGSYRIGKTVSDTWWHSHAEYQGDTSLFQYALAYPLTCIVFVPPATGTDMDSFAMSIASDKIGACGGGVVQFTGGEYRHDKLSMSFRHAQVTLETCLNGIESSFFMDTSKEPWIYAEDHAYILIEGCGQVLDRYHAYFNFKAEQQ